MSWEALKKSINGLINKANSSNIKNIVPELFAENLIRGRGLFCRSVMKAQSASPTFSAGERPIRQGRQMLTPTTPRRKVYAAVIAVINTKFPQIGELLLSRLIIQLRRAYKRNDKTVCLAVVKFLAHLVNQKLAHEIIALQILTLLLEKPTDDSVEVAVGFMREVGALLAEVSPKANNAIFERFRAILHEGQIDKRTQYMVEVLFQVRKEKFKDNPTVTEELDLVEEDDQITHYLSLDEDSLDPMEKLNVFQFDPDFLENERKYDEIKRDILGDDEDDEEEGSGGEADEDEDEEGEGGVTRLQSAQEAIAIQDQTNRDVVELRRVIYLTIMSSLNFEECAHKLLKLNIPEGQEIELANMIVECCTQERTYVNFYGLLGERFCKINRVWADCFAKNFEETFKTIHRFETNRLRNVAKYYAHLLASEALSWQVLSLITLTEQTTTSSSRIFIKILFQELAESLGLQKLNERLKDPYMVIAVETPNGTVTRGVFDGLFPRDNPRDTRFAINYFTSIGLGGLTDELREHLRNAPKLIMQQQREVDGSDESSTEDSDSDSGSDSDSSSDTSSSDSSSSSRSSSPSSRSPPRKGRGSDARRRDRSDTRSRSRSRSRSRDRSPRLGRGIGERPRSSREDDRAGATNRSTGRDRKVDRSSSRSRSRDRRVGNRGEDSRSGLPRRRDDSRDRRNDRDRSRSRGSRDAKRQRRD